MEITARISKAYLKANANCQTYSAGGMKCTKDFRTFDMSESEIETMKAKCFYVKRYDEKSKKTKPYKTPIIEVK